MLYLIGIDIGGINLRVVVILKEGEIIENFKVNNEVENGVVYNLDKLIDEIKI